MFQVSEATESGDLPGWLSWEEKGKRLFGVPALKDLGPHYLSVEALGAMNSTHLTVARDVFTIYVKEESFSR